MASLELCYYRNGQRICPPSQSVDSADAGARISPSDSTSTQGKKDRVKRKAERMLEQYLPDPPEGWTMTYTP